MSIFIRSISLLFNAHNYSELTRGCHCEYFRTVAHRCRILTGDRTSSRRSRLVQPEHVQMLDILAACRIARNLYSCSDTANHRKSLQEDYNCQCWNTANHYPKTTELRKSQSEHRLKAVLSRQRSRQRRGKAEAEAESSRPRRGRLNSRQGRGEATLEKSSFP